MAKVGHDQSDCENNTCLVGGCDVPCPSDRWCTKQLLPSNVLSDPIDPFGLEHYVETGPTWIQHKRVRFNDHPEVIIIDEGVCDDDLFQGGDTFVAVESILNNHMRECCDLSDGTPGLATSKLTDFDLFWKEFQDTWPQVTQWFHEVTYDDPEVLQCFPSMDDTTHQEFSIPGVDEVVAPQEVINEPDANMVPSDMPVSFNDWNVFVQYFCTFPIPADGLPIITYGLRHIGLGRRDDRALSLDPDYLRQLLKSLWADFAQQGVALDIHLVWPQPGSLLNEPHALVLLVEIITDPPVFPDHPVLMITSDVFGNILGSPNANYVTWPVVRGNLLQEFHHF